MNRSQIFFRPPCGYLSTCSLITPQVKAPHIRKLLMQMAPDAGCCIRPDKTAVGDKPYYPCSPMRSDAHRSERIYESYKEFTKSGIAKPSCRLKRMCYVSVYRRKSASRWDCHHWRFAVLWSMADFPLLHRCMTGSAALPAYRHR